MDDQQRARVQFEAWAEDEYGLANLREGELDIAFAAFTAALRAAPESVALRTAMETLEQIATAPDDQGAKLNAAASVAFLKTQGCGMRLSPEAWTPHPTFPLAARPQGVKDGL